MKYFICALMVVCMSVVAYAADNITVLDGNRVARTLATKDIGGVQTYKMMVTDSSGNVVNFDDHGAIGVSPHEHSSHGVVHLMADGVTTDTTYILIDLSDTTHWPHVDTAALHLEYLDMQVDASGTAEWEMHLIWLDNCSATDCDSYPIWGASGNKTTGNNLEAQVPWQQAGPILKPGHVFVLSSHTILNDTTYQTDIALPSAYIIGSASTYPGTGDLLLFADMTAGSIDIHCNIAYHTHDADHP